MSDVSAIEWTDATWNPVTGCTRVSPGCAHCYIERTPPFRIAGRRFERVGNEETTGVQLHPDRLEQPLHWRKPRRVFVCSLADLFHEDVPGSFLDRVFYTMGLAPAHTFQVLTKRPKRALDYLRDRRFRTMGHSPQMGGRPSFPIIRGEHRDDDGPLPNVWLGTSIENARYTWRADVLREIPAAVRFVSAEPLLGSLLGRDSQGHSSEAGAAGAAAAPRRPSGERATPSVESLPGRAPLDLTGIDWVIVGGESGPDARPMHPGWARELREACLAQRGFAEGGADLRPGGNLPGQTAFFFKQWGEWVPHDQGVEWRVTKLSRNRSTPEVRTLLPDGSVYDGRSADQWLAGTTLGKVGKKRAGRLLDGREWNEYPLERAA